MCDLTCMEPFQFLYDLHRAWNKWPLAVFLLLTAELIELPEQDCWNDDRMRLKTPISQQLCSSLQFLAAKTNEKSRGDETKELRFPATVCVYQWAMGVWIYSVYLHGCVLWAGTNAKPLPYVLPPCSVQESYKCIAARCKSQSTH